MLIRGVQRVCSVMLLEEEWHARSFLLFGCRSETDFCSACLQSLYCIGPNFPFQVDAGTMLYRGDCDVHLQTNEDW